MNACGRSLIAFCALLLTQTLLLWKCSFADTCLRREERRFTDLVACNTRNSHYFYANRHVWVTNWGIDCEGQRWTTSAIRRMAACVGHSPLRTNLDKQHQFTLTFGAQVLADMIHRTVYVRHPDRSRSQVNGLHRHRPWCLFSRYNIRQPNDVIRLGDCVNWFRLRGRFANWIWPVYWILFAMRFVWKGHSQFC